ncbi:MAG: YciI family protein [Bacillus sp. (in: Bacteria)]|nr:YciI family protein [Bacillus sp. (in: firmicutes)]
MSFTRYVILLSLVPGKKLTEPLIREHVQFLKGLEREGRLELCGPFTDYEGGMIVIKASSMAEAVEIAKSDPFVLSEVETFEVRTLELSCEENNHMGFG